MAQNHHTPASLYRSRRRVVRRHLRNAAFGNSTTVSAAIIWLIAFFSLWILILRTFEDNSIHNMSIMHLKTGKYASIQLDAYRQENGGKLPESLEKIGFRKGYDDNIYYFQPDEGCYSYELEYLRLNDTAYCLNFGDGFWFKGQYLSTVGFWNFYNKRYDSDSYDYVIDESWGEDAPAVYLYEYEISEWLDSIRIPLDSIVRSDRGRRQQQYMLRLLERDDTAGCITFNSILHTFDPMLWPDIDYFRDFKGYLMLDGRVCFIVDESAFNHCTLVKYNGKGRVFKVPDGRGCDGGEHYWYLDIDLDYGGKVTLKGTRQEE